MGTFFDLENEYKAVLDAEYAENRQLCPLPGAVNKVGDTEKTSPQVSRKPGHIAVTAL